MVVVALELVRWRLDHNKAHKKVESSKLEASILPKQVSFESSVSTVPDIPAVEWGRGKAPKIRKESSALRTS